MADSKKELTWPKLLSAVLATSLLVSGALWGVVQAFGNDVWAPKLLTATAIRDLEHAVIRNETLDAEHRDSTDVHMSESIKQVKFVTRPEFDAANGATHDQLNEFRGEQRQFWSEQRSVNREILNRLPRQ